MNWTDFSEVYEHLSKPHNQREFGLPWHRYAAWHIVSDEQIVMAYDGYRIFELNKDGNAYFVPHERLTIGAVRRWQDLMPSGYDFRLTSRKTSAGVRKYRLTVFQHNKNTPKRIDFYKRLRVQRIDNDAVFYPDMPPAVQKDNLRYRTFNRQIKSLESILVAQAKMGAYNDFVPPNNYQRFYFHKNMILPKLKEYIASIGGDTNVRLHYDVPDILRNTIDQWIDDKDVHRLQPIVLCCFLEHHSDEQHKETNALRRIKHGLSNVKRRFLREHCVKIGESKNPLMAPDDQDRELLQAAGLREVQVPCEAEVC